MYSPSFRSWDSVLSMVIPRDDYSHCRYAPSWTALRCLPASPIAPLDGAKVQGVGVAMVLRVVPPHVHSQATLATQDVRGHHFTDLPYLKTLPPVMQVAPVVYRPPEFPLATRLRAGHRLAQPRRSPALRQALPVPRVGSGV